MTNLSDSEIFSLTGKNFVKNQSIDDLFFSAAVNSKPITDELTVNPLFLPSSKQGLLPDLTQSATTWLEETKVTEGVTQLLSINFSDIDFDTLVAILVANALPGCWNFISFVSREVKNNLPPSPFECGLIFDCETFVTHGNYPIIATAISNQGIYIWLTQSFDGVTPYSPEYVTLGQSKRLIVAHNISFDFCRISERFNIDNPVQGLCTMAMAKSLFGAGRENLGLLRMDRTTNAMADIIQSICCSMSLVNVYEFLTNEKLPPDTKDTRDYFVKAQDFTEFLPVYNELLSYAVTDTVLTLKVFQLLYPLFIEQICNPIVLQGVIQSADSLLPIIDNYVDWVRSNASSVETVENKLLQAVTPVAKDVHESWLLGTIDPQDYPYSLSKLDWKLSKPKGWRKRSLPDGYPVNARWFTSLNNGEFSWGGNDLAYLLQLHYKGNPLQRHRSLGWFYIDKPTKLETRVPHPSGDPKQNLGCITSGSCLNLVTQGLITSSVLPQDELINLYKLLDSTSIWQGYSNRLREIKILPIPFPSER